MRLRAGAPWLLAAAGLAVAAAGSLVDLRHFLVGWLAAVSLFMGWPLGSAALLLAHALTGGRWGELLRPALRIGVATTPLLVPLLLPILLDLGALYPWAAPGAHVANRFYLNPGFMIGRVLVYLLVWLGIAALVLRGRDVARAAPVGLFLLAVTTTFAAIDLTMSLDRHFTSSVYGMIMAAEMGILALSIAILLSAGRLPRDGRADLAKLLLALVILWVYLDFMQLLIVWQSDLARDAPWYLARFRGFWGGVRLLVVVFHVAVPMALLISPQVQRSRGGIIVVSLLLIVLEAAQSWWLVLPGHVGRPGWIDLASMAGLAALAFGCARLGVRHRRVVGTIHA